MTASEERSAEDLRAIRIRVLRRVTFGLNTQALLNHQLPPEGPFDVAVANGLAAIISSEKPGEEIGDANGFVLPPTALLNKAAKHELVEPKVVALLREGVNWSQAFRHGRADNEPRRCGPEHVEALALLDSHEALQVLEQTDELVFESALALVWHEEVEPHLPFSPKEQTMAPHEEAECPSCERMTYIERNWNPYSFDAVGEGICIACGYERDDFDVSSTDGFQWALERDRS